MTTATDESVYSQAPHAVRFDWDLHGAERAASRRDIVIVVDVLRFSSAAVRALECGAHIFPHPGDASAEALAQRAGATVLRGHPGTPGTPSLSPGSFVAEHRGRRFVLCSPNGAACTYLARGAPAVFVGCLLNARAVARAALGAQRRIGAPITVIACGERLPGGGIRPCLEDYLGAGAILAMLGDDLSVEAELCRNAYIASSSRLVDLLWDCASGRELRARGSGADVRHCAQQDRSAYVPQMADDCLVPVETSD